MSIRFLRVEIVLGVILVVLLLEALRRAVTPILAGLVAVGILYLFVTEYMPGILHFRDMPFEHIVENMYLLNGMGAYGSITGISATMVAVFIIFGAFIEGSGLGTFFHNVGMRVAGRHAGGPAKVEVISSSLFDDLLLGRERLRDRLIHDPGHDQARPAPFCGRRRGCGLRRWTDHAARHGAGAS